MYQMSDSNVLGQAWMDQIINSEVDTLCKSCLKERAKNGKRPAERSNCVCLVPDSFFSGDSASDLVHKD